MPDALLLAAGVAALAGWQTVSLACLGVGLAGLVAVGLLRRRHPQGSPPELGPEQAVEIRAVRDRRGEVAAIKRLRKEQPGLGLAEAVRMVREL